METTELKEIIEEKFTALQESIDAKIKAGVSGEAILANKEIREFMEEVAKKRAELILVEMKASMPKTKEEDKKDLHKFLVAIMRKDDVTLKALDTTIGANGGYLVPQRFIDMLIMPPYEDGNIEALATRQTFTEKSGLLPNLSTGVSVSWTSENAIIVDSDPSFAQNSYTLNSLKGLNYAPRTMFYSAIDIGALLQALFVQALQSRKWADFITGTGTGQMAGLDTYSLVPRVNQTGTLLAVDDLLDAVMELPTILAPNARWIMRKDVAKYLIKKKDNEGKPLFYPDFMGSPRRYSLLGYPVEINDYMSTTLGASSDERNIYLGDIRQYWMIHRPEGMEVMISEHASFEKDQIVTRITEELDGRLVNVKGFVRIDGVKLV